MRHKLTGPIIAASTLLLFGCQSTGNESLRDINEGQVELILHEGESTKDKVKREFGSPMTTSFTDGGLEIWTYELSNLHADGKSYIPIVNLFGASASGTKKQLVVLFDQRGIVKKFTMNASPVTVKTGLFNH